MSELLEPDDAAVHARFDRLDAHLADHDRRFVDHDRRFDEHDRRFDEHDQRFDRLDEKLEDLSERVDLKLEKLQYELLAAFRGEVAAAVSGQTRAVLLGVFTTSFTIFGMTLGFSQLL